MWEEVALSAGGGESITTMFMMEVRIFFVFLHLVFCEVADVGRDFSPCRIYFLLH